MKRTVFFVSDGTGITAETLGHTLLTQFENIDFAEVTLPFVNTAERAARAVEAIDQAGVQDGARPIVISTLVAPAIQEQVAASNALVLDLFSVYIHPLEMELERRSTHTAGRSHGVVDRATYNFRIETLNFALRHDDGASTHGYASADVILVGVSRSGKTPTCLYLAMHFGVRAANYPITVDDLRSPALPEPLRAYRQRLYGLTVEPERLQQIRSERRPNSRYASLGQCRKEVQEVEAMFRDEAVPYLNTDTVSIEEIASTVMQDTGLKRRLY
ncbi:MAG: kinase/pyrophosphorylase [Gammaproteobacteria bacterium]|nr:kinase/pyrophosphorylase [Gammaproteobacteria bacterium]NIR84169.1 kinase/pyrophosphorylase [Gammaproteobacteria bacterium]NIR89481.1 kinase/pyrophosphorylase [Gammaproteobacteria bacterium]NIU05324.1 kinase/pyrophosphorylase [Gammaproteobacteria bacterium]NIV52264.1 pyruvate, phosphate dikinase/phosphoenolpyruvate synthase regulator [Gammaproteobacteria bacterium]